MNVLSATFKAEQSDVFTPNRWTTICQVSRSVEMFDGVYIRYIKCLWKCLRILIKVNIMVFWQVDRMQNLYLNPRPNMGSETCMFTLDCKWKLTTAFKNCWKISSYYYYLLFFLAIKP